MSVREKSLDDSEPAAKYVALSAKQRSMAGVSSSESSQSIVDELFKDFISKKISRTSRSATVKDVSKPTKVDEISKLLDMEISSIQAQTKEPPKEKDTSLLNTGKKEVSNQNYDSFKNSSVSQRLSSELRDFSVVNSTANIPLPPQKPVNDCSKKSSESTGECKNDSSVASTLISGSNSMLLSSAVVTNTNSAPSSVQPSASKTIGHSMKRMLIPKKLGCMLSTESLSLIKSKEKIDRNGRVWEDGEVPSSHSDNTNKEDSESGDDGGGYPSDTGSINSDKEDWKSQSSSSKHKKKHKHKHKKKKKKKSSKERDRGKGDEESEDKEGKKEKDKDKEVQKDKDKDNKSDEKTLDHNKDRENNKRTADRDKMRNGKTREKDKDLGKGSDSESSRKDGGKSSDKEKSDTSKRQDKDKEKKRKRSNRSRSRTPKRSRRSRSKSRTPKKSRKSPSPRRSHYDEWDARSYSDDPKKFHKDRSSRSRSRSGSRGHSKRKRSVDRKRESSKEGDKDLRLQIDKAKLRKIAIANALNSMKSGQPVPAQLDMASVKSGGKSVEELTDFCKRISEKEQDKHDHAVSDSSEEETVAQSDEEEPLIHHPFKVKDTSSNIVMNIRNAKQLPVLTPSEKQVQQASLRLAFPVSSGSHHRASESEWVPVERTMAPVTSTINKVTNSLPSIESQPEPPKSIFPVSSEKNVDIGSIISERLQAVRKLQANPYDVQALSSMHKAQEKASQWAQSKHLPGQFIGSTGAQIMSQEEIMGDKRHQAWVKKSQFVSAAPLRGGIGMFLLQKMGWKQGEGLGKNCEGNLEPLQVDIKIDRKGLSTAADNPRARPQAGNVPKAKDLSHKHPVSALMELCNKRRWGPPMFTIVSEDGPDHKKYFLFKVKVNNVEYQPAVPSSNKKSAKAQCAAVCLQELGLLPRDAPMNY